jgi:hypothetical protein
MTDNSDKPCGWMWVSPAGEKTFRLMPPEYDQGAEKAHHEGWRVYAVIEMEQAERREANAIMRMVKEITGTFETMFERSALPDVLVKKTKEHFSALIMVQALKILAEGSKSRL